MIKQELAQWRSEVRKYDKHSYRIYKKIKNCLDPKSMTQTEIKHLMKEIGKFRIRFFFCLKFCFI